MSETTAYPTQVATAVLLFLVHHPGTIRELNLEAEHFADADLARMYSWLAELVEDETPPTSITDVWDRAHTVGGQGEAAVQAWCDRIGEGGLPVMHDRKNIEHVRSMATVLRRARARREVMLAQDEVDKLGADPGEAAEKLRELAGRVETWQQEAEGVVVTHAKPSAVFRDTLDRPELVVDLGWPRLMGRMGGGLPRGDILTVMGCTSVGKTTWALNSIERFLVLHPRERCVVFSLEMPARQLITRQLMAYTSTTRAELEECFAGRAPWPDLTRSASDWDITAANLVIDEGCRTVAQMRSALDNLGGATLVVIDYLQLINRPGTSKEYEAITRNMYDLKALAKTCDCAVLLISQVPREITGPDKAPGLRSGKGSGAIEDTSDFLAGVWRPHYKDEAAREQELVTLSLGLLKSRHGWEGKTPYELDRPKQKVREL